MQTLEVSGKIRNVQFSSSTAAIQTSLSILSCVEGVSYTFQGPLEEDAGPLFRSAWRLMPRFRAQETSPSATSRGGRPIMHAYAPSARNGSSRMNGHHFPFASDPFAARFFSPLTMKAPLADRCRRLVTVAAALADRCRRLLTVAAALADRYRRLVTVAAALADRCRRLVTVAAPLADRCGRLVTVAAPLADRCRRLVTVAACPRADLGADLQRAEWLSSPHIVYLCIVSLSSREKRTAAPTTEGGTPAGTALAVPANESRTAERAPHGWAVVAPLPCVGDEPIGHESRRASHQPSRRAVGPVRRQKTN